MVLPVSGHPYVGYGCSLNENGNLKSYGYGSHDFLGDVLTRTAVDFIHRASHSTQPLLLYIAPFAPHQPATPAIRDNRKFVDLRAPRPPSFNKADVADKPSWVRGLHPLPSSDVNAIDDLYRRRVQSSLAIDALIGRVLHSLEAEGQLERTYIFFTSDNGFHLGEHRLLPGKYTAYEEDIRVPLIVRGPGIAPGTARFELVGNLDLAPTCPAGPCPNPSLRRWPLAGTLPARSTG